MGEVIIEVAITHENTMIHTALMGSSAPDLRCESQAVQRDACKSVRPSRPGLPSCRLAWNRGLRWRVRSWLRRFGAAKHLKHRISIFKVNYHEVHTGLRLYGKPGNSPAIGLSFEPPKYLGIRLTAFLVRLAPDAMHDHRVRIFGVSFAASHLERGVGCANGLDTTANPLQFHLRGLGQQVTSGRVIAAAPDLVEKLAYNVCRLRRIVLSDLARRRAGARNSSRGASTATDQRRPDQCGSYEERIAEEIILGEIPSHGILWFCGERQVRFRLPFTLGDPGMSRQIVCVMFRLYGWICRVFVQFLDDWNQQTQPFAYRPNSLCDTMSATGNVTGWQGNGLAR
jgi:hypothetical protein